MKNYNKTTILLMSFVFTFSLIKGQSSTVGVNPVNFILPEASSLMKYVDYPVSYLTGTPEINLPLHTIESGKLSLSLALNFHIDNYARVNQIPGTVGAGWTLTPNLQITRMVNGLEDFSTNGYYNCSGSLTANYNGAEVFPSQDRLWQIHKGYLDEEPDKFYYSTLQNSGVFYFQKQNDGSMKAVPVPYSGVKIEYNRSTFTIIDTDGAIYTYSPLDTEEMAPATSITTGWRCTSIQSPGGLHEITLKYDIKYKMHDVNSFNNERMEIYDDWQSYVGPYEYYSETTWGKNFQIKEDAYPLWKMTGPKMITYGGYESKLWLFSSGHVFVHPDEVKDYSVGGTPARSFKTIKESNLSEINFPGGLVQFTYTDYHILSNITIKDNNNLTVKSVNFEQQGSDYARCLKKMIVNDRKYEFAYGFEHKGGNSVKSDFWGYKAIPAGDYPELPLQTIQVLMGSHDKFFLDQAAITDKHPMISIGYLNLFDYNPIQKNILTIVYPTGGKTEFIVGQHKFKDRNGDAKGAGGYRIEKISYYDAGVSTPVKEKIYRYGSLAGAEESGLGMIKFEPETSSTFGNTYTEQRINYHTGLSKIVHSARKRTFFPGTIRSLNFENGSCVNYNEVTEYEKDLGTTTGKTTYMYDLGFYTPAYASPTDPYPLEPAEWDLAPLKSITWYKSTGNSTYEWVKKKSFSYNKYVDPIQTFRGRAFVSEICTYIGSESWSEESTKKLTVFSYKSGGIKTGSLQLIKETEEDKYSSGEIVKNETNYFYDNPSRIRASRIENILSDGKKLLTQNKYPYDFSSDPVYGSMTERNIINPVIESNTSIDGNTISVNKTNYKDWGANKFLPETIQSGKNQSLLEVRLTYHNYDSRSNPLYITKNNADKVVYLWGYNYQYPIAEIKGVSYEDVKSQLGIDPETLAQSISPTMSYVDGLRAKLPKAMVTTYTYKPLVGMTSMTDPAGVRTTYDYDDFGRLRTIIDHEGNIIEHYKYNYQNK